MNRISIYLTCLAVISAVTFCGSDDSSSSGDDDVYITTNLPSEYTVETPDTLSVSGTLDTKPGSGRELTEEECNVLLGFDEAENGYETLVDKVGEIKSFIQEFEFEFLMIDQIVPQLQDAWEASSQTEPLEFAGGELEPVIFSQSMYNRMAEIFGPILAEINAQEECFDIIGGGGGGPGGDFGDGPPLSVRKAASSGKITLGDIIPFKVGDEIPTPPLSYEYDADAAYNNTIVYSFDQSDAAGGQVPDDISFDASTTIKWTDDKLSMAVTRKFEDDFGDSTSTTTYDASGEYATSTFTDSSGFSFGTETILFEFNISLNECQSDSERCVELQYSNKSEDSFGTFSEIIVGKADNAGGFIQTTYSGSDAFGTFEDIFRELFDADGNIIASETAVNGVFSGDGDFAGSPFFDDLAGSGGGFEGGLAFGTPITVSFTGLTGSEDFSYVLVPTGFLPGDPGTDQRFQFEINILGAGYVYIDNSNGINDQFADFWGPDNFNFGSLRAYKETFNGTTGEITYNQITVTVSGN